MGGDRGTERDTLDPPFPPFPGASLGFAVGPTAPGLPVVGAPTALQIVPNVTAIIWKHSLPRRCKEMRSREGSCSACEYCEK